MLVLVKFQINLKTYIEAKRYLLQIYILQKLENYLNNQLLIIPIDFDIFNGNILAVILCLKPLFLLYANFLLIASV